MPDSEPFVPEELKEETETDARIGGVQQTTWNAAHASGLTANMQTMVLEMGQQRESTAIPSSGGGRSVNGTIPIPLQNFDGQTFAMGIFKNPFERMQDAVVKQDPGQRQTIALVDENLMDWQEEMLRRDPAKAFVAAGSVQAGRDMIAAITPGSVASVLPGGPEAIEDFSKGPKPPQPVNAGPTFEA